MSLALSFPFGCYIATFGRMVGGGKDVSSLVASLALVRGQLSTTISGSLSLLKLKISLGSGDRTKCSRLVSYPSSGSSQKVCYSSSVGSWSSTLVLQKGHSLEECLVLRRYPVDRSFKEIVERKDLIDLVSSSSLGLEGFLGLSLLRSPNIY